ncbi:MAG: cytochrome P450 [Geminicoccaceae bacterium]
MTIFDIKSPPEGFIDDPYPTYSALRHEAPVLKQSDGSFVVSSYRALDTIYRDTRTFSSDKKIVFRPKFGLSPLYEHHTMSLVFNDPPLHTRVRQIMVGAMTPRAIARMEPGLIALVDGLLDDLAGRSDVDLIDDFASRIPIHVIGNLFDMPMADREPLRAWSLAILGALEPTLTPEQQARGNDAVLAFKAYLAALADDRREHPGNPETDVLTRLMQSDVGHLSESELLQNCIFILNAGHETTTNLISNALALLNDMPDARRMLIEDPALMATAVDEFLRFESPNQFGNRLTSAEVTIDDVLIPAGADLHLCIGAANRDETAFADADRLQPDRRPNKHLAFAGGPHTCVGLSLARLEGRVALGRFLDRFPAFEINARRRSPRLRFRGFTSLTATLNEN